MTDNYGRGSDGKFLPGNSGKPIGATKNKLRDMIRTFLNDNFDKLPVWFEELNPRDKMKVYIDLLPFCISRLQSVNLTDQEGNDLPKATIDYSRLSPEALKEVLSLTTIQNEERKENL